MLSLLVVVVMSVALAASANESEHHAPFVLDTKEGETIAFPPHPTRRLAGSETNQAGLSLFEIEIPARTAGAPPHTHTHEDEFFYVRAGSVTFLTNGARKTIGAGGFTMLPRGSLHAVWNAGEENAVLLVGTSGGKFGDFFDAVALEVRKTHAKTPEAVGAIVAQVGAERGVIIQMDQVPEDVAALYGL